jgi:hypothetical protein
MRFCHITERNLSKRFIINKTLYITATGKLLSQWSCCKLDNRDASG